MFNFGNWFRRPLTLTVGLLALSGCGGGGTSGTLGSNGSVGFYVGDSFAANYSEVWTTIYHVDASVDGTTWKPVFDSASGMQVNLSALSSTAQFMGGMNMAAGNYTVAKVTMADHMKLVATGGAVTNPPVQAPTGTDAAGKYTFTVSMPMSVTPGTMVNMALDFNLANFQMQGGTLVMAVQQMNPTQFAGMQHQGWLHGSVSNLVPGASFSLGMGMMNGVAVLLTPTTLVTSQSSGQSTTLANGQVVEVQGTVNPATHVITATSIQVLDGNGVTTYAGLQGSVATVDALSGSFTMNPGWASGFTPGGTTVTVTTNANTIFTKPIMAVGSFADITQGGTAMVTGTFDSTSGTVTANRVMIF